MSNGERLATLAPGVLGAAAWVALRGTPLPMVPALVAGSPTLPGATVGGCRRSAAGQRLMLAAAMWTISTIRARRVAGRDGWHPREFALVAASIRQVRAVGVLPASHTVRPPATRVPSHQQHQQAVSDSFAVFYEQAKDPVYRAVLAVTGSRVRAEDATAEAFADALARWEELCGHPDGPIVDCMLASIHARMKVGGDADSCVGAAASGRCRAAAASRGGGPVG